MADQRWLAYEEFIEKVEGVLRETLALDGVDREAGVEDVGLDSLGLIEFAIELEDALDLPADAIRGNLPKIDREASVGSLIDALYATLLVDATLPSR